MQSKKMSFVESWTNVAVGYAINFLGQLFIYPLVGVHVKLSTNLLIGAFFTVISVARSYCIRRWYNRLGDRKKCSVFRTPCARAHRHGQKPRA